MQLAVVGINHNTAPVEIREKLSLDDSQLKDEYELILGNERIYEALIISTCNRVEYYIVTDDFLCNVESVINRFAERIGEDVYEIKKYIYIYCGNEALKHLFKVACGLDSLVLGEPQILGQVKDAFDKAKMYGRYDTYLKQLEQYTLKTAKKVRTHTGISENPVSVSYAAVELAKKIFGDLKNNIALIIGAGEMCELAAKHLVTSNIKKIYVTNRTFSRAEILAEEINGEAIPFDNFYNKLNEVDIVISSTGAPTYILTYEQVKSVMKQRKYSPMFFIDIAVPRDIDPEIERLDNVYVYDIDDLKEVVEANKRERQKEAAKALKYIEQSVEDFNRWLKSLNIVPVIKLIRSTFEDLKESELERFFKKNKIEDEALKKQISYLLTSYMNKVLHNPLNVLKSKSADNAKYTIAEAAEILFKLKE
ncbi:glutamyl-tRNA reductase [Deferribacter desulfuricans SSM1]|uniref:Glutamyl-tRNA reductase n=1 Tax=Deferribacter desulfuricans (strain DSM 14783 / JCM 11476 / NBRC 101012 / SSM1) TaxID=639282 RepID=D3PCG4_DEFDS|nr:glutamyl-tRNA reductase [Deferribacter desulfuricans]BAI80287.1 glutamyl-tRNA reductase [Deferribacter desulfuricans SSM1]